MRHCGCGRTHGRCSRLLGPSQESRKPPTDRRRYSSVAILLYWLSLPCSHQKMETSQESDFVFITQHTFSESFLEISTEIPLHHFLTPKLRKHQSCGSRVRFLVCSS